MKKLTLIGPVAAFAMLAWGATANAVTCTAISPLSDPDATLTNASACGPGIINDNNDEAADISTVLGGGVWTEIDKDDPDVAGSSSNGVLRTTGFPGSSGSWAFNAVAGSNSYVIVIKDGGAPGGNAPESIYWTWFRVDTSAGCDGASALSGFNFCGNWTMFGDAGKIKGISHMTLYSSNRRFDVPEPGSLALLGLGLLGVAAARRRRA